MAVSVRMLTNGFSRLIAERNLDLAVEYWLRMEHKQASLHRPEYC